MNKEIKTILDEKSVAKFLKERINGELITVFPYSLATNIFIEKEGEQDLIPLSDYLADLLKDIDETLVGDSVTLFNYPTFTEVEAMLKPVIERLEAQEAEEIKEVFSDYIYSKEDVDSENIENAKPLTTKLPSFMVFQSKVYDEKL